MSIYSKEKMKQIRGGERKTAKNTSTSNLAGEFLVAGELSRRGYLVSITLGKAKAIDIFANTQEGKTIKIDVKASSYKTSWPIAKADKNLHYIFVYLQAEDKLRTESKAGTNTPPEYYIVPGKDIIEKALIRPWKSIPGIPYNSLKDYKERWDILPQP